MQAVRDFKTRNLSRPMGIVNLVGDLAARVIIEEVLEKIEELRAQEEPIEELEEDLEFEEIKEAFENEEPKPRVPRGKASSDKRAKGHSSQRKGYG